MLERRVKDATSVSMQDKAAVKVSLPLSDDACDDACDFASSRCWRRAYYRYEEGEKVIFCNVHKKKGMIFGEFRKIHFGNVE